MSEIDSGGAPSEEGGALRSSGAPDRELRLIEPGRLSYTAGLELQAALVERRRAGTIPDTLILLEHPPVITLGTGSSPDHLLFGPEERAARGIELHEAGRGGDVTYHGPGQLVGYPILDLKPDRKDLHRYLRDLEEVLIRTVRAFGIEAGREEGLTGVWTPGGKIAAIGVRVSSGWITSHGFALNVRSDLSGFESIVPCGIEGRTVTSLSVESGREVELGEVRNPLLEGFAEVFGRVVRG